MSKNLSVMFLIDYFHRTGGTERHLALLSRHLASQGIECTVVAFDLGANPLLDEMRAAGVNIIHLPVAREYTPNALRRAIELHALIRRIRPDIVQTFHQKADTYGVVIAKLAGVRRLVSSKRDTGALRKPRHYFLNRRLRGLFDRIIVVADAVADAVVANDHLDRARIVKIYNGVDLASFNPAPPAEVLAERQRLGFAPGDFVVGMVAGFRPEKNHDVFFAGLQEALPRIPSLRVLAVGGGPLLETYRARYAGDAGGLRVTFTGDVRDVRPYLQVMDVGCLLPGANEGFSNAVVESMAMGLPMVVTKVGGNAEAVVDGANGFVIPPLDAAALTRALVTLWSDPDRRAAMGRRSRRLVEEQFSLSHMCAEHVRLYRALQSTASQEGASVANLS